MVSLHTPICNFGWKALDFNLLGVDGQYYNLTRARGPRGLLIMFICNHCPYVQAVRSRIVRDAKELMQHGIHSIAIMPNDYRQYPEDSFENMKQAAAEFRFPFPYVLDETQQVARDYGAVCTPDFFGFDADLGLQYRGRLDASRRETAPGARRDLFEAMCQVAATGQGPAEQVPSIGCSIKWRADTQPPGQTGLQ
jgi:peroxiredoxin